MSTKRIGAGALAALAIALGAGCGSEDPTPIEMSGPPPMFAEDPGAQEVGPHGGRLIALGRNGKYRAELLADSTSGEVRLCVLDKRLRKVGLAEQKAILNLVIADEVSTFELPAASARDKTALVFEFALADKHLAELLQGGQAESCKVRLMIDEKAYTGVLSYNALARNSSPPDRRL
jgi:hypothetical protein